MVMEVKCLLFGFEVLEIPSVSIIDHLESKLKYGWSNASGQKEQEDLILLFYSGGVRRDTLPTSRK